MTSSLNFPKQPGSYLKIKKKIVDKIYRQWQDIVKIKVIVSFQGEMWFSRVQLTSVYASPTSNVFPKRQGTTLNP